MITGGAPSSVKKGVSKEKVRENVKKTKSQLTIRVSKFPRINENSVLILVRRPTNSLNSLSRFSETMLHLNIFNSLSLGN
jgi:hypothetical protein